MPSPPDPGSLLAVWDRSGYGPDQVVARDSTGGLTAAALQQESAVLAAALQLLGIKVLALQADNGIPWLVIDLACQQADICLIPLPEYFSSGQLQHVFDLAAVDAVICQQAEQLQRVLGDRIQQQLPFQPGDLTLLKLRAVPGGSALPAQTGKITFTSGSTGQPKGVCLANAQLLLQARALSRAVNIVAPRHLCLLPLSTLLENVAGLYAPLLSGGELIIPSLGEIGFVGSSELNAQKFLSTIQHYQPNSIILTPQLLLILVNAAATGWQAPPSLRFVAVGGGKVSYKLLQQAVELGIPAFEGYGLSECASVVSLNTPAQNRPGSCGQPLPHVQVQINDGEVVVTGNAMLGYLGEPESYGVSTIQTGDLGEIDAQGYLHINGRRKNLLISSFGRNINPEWVESELLSQPLLSECVVMGDARPYCVALLTPRQQVTSDLVIQQHIDQVNTGLPDYAQVKRWHRLKRPLSAQAGLLTANGRPQRPAIAEQYAGLLTSLYPEPFELESA
ncbi:MAG TPA: AMP-binding protein [Xanthomonadales bacterium]|nr:AMP-binding protein [Xanthomonadales bacterium]